MFAISPDTTILGYVDGCPGMEVCFTAANIYFENNSHYHQSDSTSIFTWDFGDSSTGVGKTVCHTYNRGGIFNVVCTVSDIVNCQASIVLQKSVRVFMPPNFAGTSVNTTEICPYDTVFLSGTAKSTSFLELQLHIDELTWLPDGYGVHYLGTFNCTTYPSGNTITSANDIESICVNMEHSYLGDLHMKLVCPNGQFVNLKSYPGGVGTFLGHPVDNSIPGIFGVGYEYCWTNNPTYGIMLSEVGHYTTSFIDNYGNTYTNAPWLPPGTYTPEQPFSNLIGCPIKGTWTLDIIDNLAIDDGYIFERSIAFAPYLYPDLWDFSSSLDSVAWLGNNLILQTDSTAIAIPPTSGWQSYTFVGYNELGCQFDTTFLIFVHPLSSPINVNIALDSIWPTITWSDTVGYCETSKSNTFVGYNIYLDYMTTPIATNITDTSYSFVNTSAGFHTAGVSAVYNTGESAIKTIDFTWTNVDENNIYNTKVYPSPSKGIINIDKVDNADIYIYNAMGVLIEAKEDVSGKTSINLSTNDEGIYLIKIVTKNRVINKKINLIK